MIPCMNCQSPVPEKDGRVFAEVFVCPTCHAMAERMYVKCEGELRRMLLLLKETIRISLVEGKLRLPPAQALEEVSKEDLLKMIVTMTEKKHAAAARPALR